MKEVAVLFALALLFLAASAEPRGHRRRSTTIATIDNSTTTENPASNRHLNTTGPALGTHPGRARRKPFNGRKRSTTAAPESTTSAPASTTSFHRRTHIVPTTHASITATSSGTTSKPSRRFPAIRRRSESTIHRRSSGNSTEPARNVTSRVTTTTTTTTGAPVIATTTTATQRLFRIHPAKKTIPVRPAASIVSSVSSNSPQNASRESDEGLGGRSSFGGMSTLEEEMSLPDGFDKPDDTSIYYSHLPPSGLKNTFYSYSENQNFNTGVRPEPAFSSTEQYSRLPGFKDEPFGKPASTKRTESKKVLPPVKDIRSNIATVDKKKNCRSIQKPMPSFVNYNNAFLDPGFQNNHPVMMTCYVCGSKDDPYADGGYTEECNYSPSKLSGDHSDPDEPHPKIKRGSKVSEQPRVEEFGRKTKHADTNRESVYPYIAYSAQPAATNYHNDDESYYEEPSRQPSRHHHDSKDNAAASDDSDKCKIEYRGKMKCKICGDGDAAFSTQCDYEKEDPGLQSSRSYDYSRDREHRYRSKPHRRAKVYTDYDRTYTAPVGRASSHSDSGHHGGHGHRDRGGSHHGGEEEMYNPYSYGYNPYRSYSGYAGYMPSYSQYAPIGYSDDYDRYYPRFASSSSSRNYKKRREHKPHKHQDYREYYGPDPEYTSLVPHTYSGYPFDLSSVYDYDPYAYPGDDEGSRGSAEGRTGTAADDGGGATYEQQELPQTDAKATDADAAQNLDDKKGSAAAPSPVKVEASGTAIADQTKKNCKVEFKEMNSYSPYVKHSKTKPKMKCLICDGEDGVTEECSYHGGAGELTPGHELAGYHGGDLFDSDFLN